MCYHVAIVVELRANIANYFDLKKVKGQGCKKQTIQETSCNFNYFLKPIPSILWLQSIADLAPKKKPA
jgi:hypothetical protein